MTTKKIMMVKLNAENFERLGHAITHQRRRGALPEVAQVKSSQVCTLLKAKSKTRSKQNKDMHKCSSVYSERGVPPGFDIGRRMGRCLGMQICHPRPTKSLRRHSNF